MKLRSILWTDSHLMTARKHVHRLRKGWPRALGQSHDREYRHGINRLLHEYLQAHATHTGRACSGVSASRQRRFTSKRWGCGVPKYGRGCGLYTRPQNSQNSSRAGRRRFRAEGQVDDSRLCIASASRRKRTIFRWCCCRSDAGYGRVLGTPAACCPRIQCAVKRRESSVGANPTRHLSLQPVATGAAEEVTNRPKPSV